MSTTSIRQSSEVTKVLRDTMQYIPSTIFPSLCGMIAVYIYTREFSASQYGMYNFILSVTTPVTLLLTEWAAQPTGRYYAEYVQKGILDVYRRGIVALMAIIMGAALVLALISGCILVVGTSFDVFTFTGIAACVLTQAAFVLPARILPSSLRADRYKRISVLVSVISIGSSLLLIVCIGRNIAWLFWGQALANTVLIPVLMRWTQLSFRIEFLHITQEFKNLFFKFVKYGAPMLIWFLSNNILDDEDRWILQLFHGPEQVGIYGVNYNLISTVANFMSVPVVSAIGPILYNQWSLRQFDEAKQTISSMTELYAILAAMVLGGTAVVGTSVVHLLFGQAFWPGASILIPVLIGRIFWGSASIGHRTLELSESTMTMGISGIAAACVNLVLNFIFVPHFGYQAAALSTAISYCMYAVIIQIQSRRHVPWKVNQKYISIYLLLGITCAVAIRICVLTWIKDASPLEQLTVGLLTYLLLYICMLYLTMKKRISNLLRFQF